MRTLLFIFILLIASSYIFISCDILYKQHNLTLAVAQNDYASTYCSSHLKPFLERGGFKIKIVNVATTIEANSLVAKGEADITFVLNHSLFMPKKLGVESNQLRSIIPLFEPAMFLFSKDSAIKETSHEMFFGKKVGVEKIDGESHLNFVEIVETGKIDSVDFTENWAGDFFHFWGTQYGQRSQSSINKRWSMVSIDNRLRDFLIVNCPSLQKFTLPAFPGDPKSKPVHTLSSQALLICNAVLSERTVYDLTQYVFRHKLELMTYDRMYYSINEAFDKSKLLYPLHRGVDSYLRRDQPSFLERYADTIALVITVIALGYGGTQTLSKLLSNRKKERLQQYFIDFITLREDKELELVERSAKLNELLQKMLKQMTKNKLDKNDFHIFSHLIQQELTIIKLYQTHVRNA